MGKLLKAFTDPLSIFGGSDGGILSSIIDPIGLFGGKKGSSGGLFSKVAETLVAQQQPAAAAPDTLMTPTVMPTAEGDAQRAARRRSQVEQAKRRGRQSTILTGNDDSLGATG